MSREKARARRTGTSARRQSARTGPKPDDHYDIVYYRRQADDDPTMSAPGREFLDGCPPQVRARFRAVLIAVAAAPPPRFAGGGKWEAMHGEMAGLYEVRIDGTPKRTHYRPFCLLDANAEGGRPMLVIIDGDKKPFRTKMPAGVYRRVLRHRAEYLSRRQRSLA